MMKSLCLLCSEPMTCRLCALILNPQRITSKTLQSIRSARVVVPQRTTATIDVKPNPELVRQVEAERARNAALKAAAVKYAAHVTRVVADPQRTVPTAPRHVAPAAAPAPAPVMLNAPLVRGDWAGLSARVDAGRITTKEAEAIGSEWLHGVTQMRA